MPQPGRSLWSMDVAVLWAQLAGQFGQLDSQSPALWPTLPRLLLCMAPAVLTMALAWLLDLGSVSDVVQTEHQEEIRLRTAYQGRLAQAVNLVPLRQQHGQAQVMLRELERQLPSKAEMAALLSEVNQAGLERRLQFELFRPGAVVVRNGYAEQSITLRVSGGYHDMGAFAADLARLPRIVTLGNIAIAPATTTDVKHMGQGILVMEATAHTYRALDLEEQLAQQNSAAKKGGG